MADAKQPSTDDAATQAGESSSPRLTTPAMEQEQRRQKVQRDAKQDGAGSKDPDEPVNQDG